MSSEVCRIFYTDDDMDDRDIFVDAARQVSESLQIITQRGGDELLSLLNSPPLLPNLIFLDLNMPVKNGYQVLQEIRLSERTKSLPVIIFSTSDDEKAINTTRQLGANLYIPKPTSFSSLKKAIEFSVSIDWDSFNPSSEGFVYRG